LTRPVLPCVDSRRTLSYRDEHTFGPGATPQRTRRTPPPSVRRHRAAAAPVPRRRGLPILMFIHMRHRRRRGQALIDNRSRPGGAAWLLWHGRLHSWVVRGSTGEVTSLESCESPEKLSAGGAGAVGGTGSGSGSGGSIPIQVPLAGRLVSQARASWLR
jgi:hypothetical protein